MPSPSFFLLDPFWDISIYWGNLWDVGVEGVLQEIHNQKQLTKVNYLPKPSLVSIEIPPPHAVAVFTDTDAITVSVGGLSFRTG